MLPFASGNHIVARLGRGTRLPPTSTTSRLPDATPWPLPRPIHVPSPALICRSAPSADAPTVSITTPR